MNRRLLQVGVVGLGVGEQHLRGYWRHEHCRVRRLVDLDPNQTTRLIAELGDEVTACSFADLVADPSIDVVSVASYDDDHYQQVVDILTAGKHVFVEKPLCRSRAELLEIQRAWLSTKCALAVNLVLRSAPLYVWLRSLINSGELGAVYAIDGDYLYGRLHKITEGWRKDVLDYSVMQGGGVHLVDLMIWLTGQRPVEVVTAGNRMCSADTEFRYDDYMAATFTFPSGLIGRITANFGCVHRHQHVLRVFGTKATFIYDDQGARIYYSRDPDQQSRPVAQSPLPSTKGDLIPSFVEMILNNADASAHAQHEFDVMSACVAADYALEKGKPVKVEYL